MEEKEYEQRLNILLEENRKKQLLIINSLNAIGYAIMGKLYSNIKIIEEDYFITFDLVKLKFNYLKQLLEEDSEPYSLEWFSLLAFEILFFDTNNFNVDNLEEKVKCFKIDFGRYVEHHANYYDTKGNLLPFGEEICPPLFEKNLNIPCNINQMIELAEKLSKNIPFIRVDFYNVKSKIYFGELTLFPASGMGRFTDSEWDYTLGNWIELPQNEKL
jgi:hypothetical protein